MASTVDGTFWLVVGPPLLGCTESLWAWRIQLILLIRVEMQSFTLGFHWEEFSLSTLLTSVGLTEVKRAW